MNDLRLRPFFGPALAALLSCSGSQPGLVEESPSKAPGATETVDPVPTLEADAGNSGAIELPDAGVAAAAAGTGDVTPIEPDAGMATPPPPPPTVRFVAFGDSGKANNEQYQVAQAMEKKCAQSGCDFGLILGDVIYDTGPSSATDPQFQTKFEQPYAALNFPFYIALGNHDYGGGGTGTDFYKGQYAVEYTQHSTKWTLPAPYYRFTREHVELVATDSNMQMFELDADQENDVRGWLDSSTATWKIAFGHHPYRSNGPHGNAGDYEGFPWVPIVNGKGVKDFFEGAICGRADLYLSGHDHSRQWLSDTCNGTELVVSGAGAGGSELPGTNLTRFQSIDVGFLYVKIEGLMLTAQFINANGDVEFERTLIKN